MRGLPFPSDAAFNREQSYDFPSPGPNGTSACSDIPAPLDLMLCPVPGASISYYSGVTPVNGANGHAIEPDAVARASRSLSPSYVFHQYAQGPQGDPFAPQPSHFLQDPGMRSTTEQTSAASKITKRRKKPRREEECGFCGGNDEKNRRNIPERMVTCNDCGRSGHPSCMELGDIGETLRSYQWKCIECKNCEICREKGEDERILFCDNCDRGWHMDCLNPPLEENPEGSWFCPLCQPDPDALVAASIQHPEPHSVAEIPHQLSMDAEIQIDPALQTEMDIDPALRNASDEAILQTEGARHSIRQLQRLHAKLKDGNARDRKGKGRAVEPRSEEEAEVDIDDCDEELFSTKSPIPSRSNKAERRKSRGRPRNRARSESISGDILSSSASLHPSKKTKYDGYSPSPSSRQKASESHPRVVVRLRLPSSKGKGKAREEDEDDEQKKGLFDDILSPEDRDVARTIILSSDKERFEKTRQLAELKLIPQVQIESVDLLSTPGPSAGRFPLRSTVHQLHQLQVQHAISNTTPASPSPSTPGPSYSTKYDTNTLRIRTIRFGPHDIQTWFDAPFPEEFSNIPDGRLWICEFCLRYMKSRFGAQRHRLKCKSRHPPGDEIYRDGNISIFEVDGRKNKIYCQNLCLLSKMFLDHKSLFYDVEPFLFYVITEADDFGARFVGYFSKEKRSLKDLNLSCIVTLPVRQRQGFGSMLIDFSYLLSKKEQKSGTPERPLTALGAIRYKKYWTFAIMRYLHSAPSNLRLEDISAATAMNLEDIYYTLTQLNMITVHESPKTLVRPSPGRSVKINRTRKSGIARRNLQKIPPKDEDRATNTPFTPPSNYEIYWVKEEVERYLTEWESKGYLVLKPEKLKWTPFLVSRGDIKSSEAKDQMVNIESTPALASSDTASIAAVVVNTPDDSVTDSRRDSVGFASELSDKLDHTQNVNVQVMELSASRNEDNEKMQMEDLGSVRTASPSPIHVPQSGAINGLEALAAVAYAVSKANNVSFRKKSSNNDGQSDLSNQDWLPPTTSSAAPNVLRSTAIKPIQNHHVHTLQRPSSRHQVSSEPTEHYPAESHTLFPSHLSVTGVVKNESVLSPSDLLESVENDAELAARLAREEGSRRRSLRSSVTSHGVGVSPTRSVQDLRPKELSRSNKKPLPALDSPPSTPVLLGRRTTRRQAQSQGLGLESPTKACPGRIARQSSRMSADTGENESPMGLHAHINTSGIRSSARLGARRMSPSQPHEPQSPLQTHSSYTSSGRRISGQSNDEVVSASSSASVSTPTLVVGGGNVMSDELVDIDAEGEEDDMDAVHGAYVHEAAAPAASHHGVSVKLQNDYSHGHPESDKITATMTVPIITLHFDATQPSQPSPGDLHLMQEMKSALNGQGTRVGSLRSDEESTTESGAGIAGVDVGVTLTRPETTTLQGFNGSSSFPQTAYHTGGVKFSAFTDEPGEDMDAEGEVDEDAVGEPDPDVFR